MKKLRIFVPAGLALLAVAGVTAQRHRHRGPYQRERASRLTGKAVVSPS